MKTKKLLSILLSILMLTGVFAVNASAESAINENDVFVAGTLVSGAQESYWLTVDGALTADGASASNYNVKYTPAAEDAAAKVTLRNASISKLNLMGESLFAGIYADCALDVEISGSNTFTILPDGLYYAYGICASDDLNIYGNGSLKMDLGNAATAAAGGIISNNKLNVSDDVDITVNASGFNTIYGAYSLYASSFSDNVSLEINATCYKNETYPDALYSFDGYKITYDGIMLSDNAKVNVKANNPDSISVVIPAFYINGSVELSGNSHLTAIAADGAESYGICMDNGNITVSGKSTITAKAGDASEDRSIGILCYNGNATALTVTASDNAKIIASAGDALLESGGICAHAEFTATDNSYISGTAGNSSSNESAGAWFWYGASLSGNAQVKGISGDAKTESYGVYVGDNSSITASDNAVIDGYAGKAAAESCGIKAGEGISASGKTKLTGESKGSIGDTSAGIFTEEDFKAYGEAEINAKGGDGSSSCGLYTKNATVYGSAKINAVADKAYQNSFGFGAEGVATITENSQVTAKSGDAYASYGIFGFDNVAHSLTVSGNASVTAEAAEGTKRCSAIFMPSISISGNAKVTATAGDSEEFSFGLACFDAKIRNAATVEATGNHSALYMQDSCEITGYGDVYIAVSTDTNPENAVEYDNSDMLTAYETEEALYNSPYKYVLIAPEAPEEPEPELSFFEQLLADIASFFNSIIEFFTSLFSLVG